MGTVASVDPEQPKGLWLSSLSWIARQPPVTWFLVNVVNTRFYPGFASYQDRAGDRRIPVIVCAPEDEDQPRS